MNNRSPSGSHDSAPHPEPCTVVVFGASGDLTKRKLLPALYSELDILNSVAVPVHDLLHLKCVCSPLDEATMLLAETHIPPEVFRDVRILRVPAAERFSCRPAFRPRAAPSKMPVFESLSWINPRFARRMAR